MKNLLILTFIILFSICTSCVNRVSVPDDQLPMLAIDLQLVKGALDNHAVIHTSNNLNGTYPIEHPEDIEIRITDATTDDSAEFRYNEETKVYDYLGDINFLRSNRALRLSASMLGSNIGTATAKSTVPKSNEIIETTLVRSEVVSDSDTGEEFWQGTIRFNLQNLNTNEPLYYQLLLNEKLQTKEVVGGEVTYEDLTQKPSLYNIISVNSGARAVKEFYHQEGLWINLSQFEEEYFEVIVRSTFPQAHDNQTNDNLLSVLYSVTEDHYNYHLGLHNIESSNSSIFSEQGLYRTNIEKGIGIFSTCVKNTQFTNLSE